MEIIVTAIGLVSGVISLFFLVYKPLNESSLAVKQNSMSNESLSKTLEEFKEDFKEHRSEEKKELEKLWEHNRKQDKRISDNTINIRIIEERVENNGKERD